MVNYKVSIKLDVKEMISIYIIIDVIICLVISIYLLCCDMNNKICIFFSVF